MDRLFSTKSFLQGYTNARYGILPSADVEDGAEEQVAPNLLSGTVPPELKDKLDEKSKTAMQFPSWVTELQARAPALATGLKVAIATLAGVKAALIPGEEEGGKGGKKDAAGKAPAAKGGKGGKGGKEAEEAQAVDPKVRLPIDGAFSLLLSAPTP